MEYLFSSMSILSYLIIVTLSICCKSYSENLSNPVFLPVINSSEERNTEELNTFEETLNAITNNRVKSNDFVYGDLRKIQHEKSLSNNLDGNLPRSSLSLHSTDRITDQNEYLNPNLPSQIHDECKALLYNFTSFASNFTICVIENSQNGSICRDCQILYLSFVDQYNDILQKEGGNYSCKDELLNLSQMAVLTAFHDVIETSWINGSCDDCFMKENGSVSNKLTEEAVEFFKLLKNFYDCVNNYTFMEGGRNVSAVCRNCYKHYDNLTSSLGHLLKNPSGVCKDLTDNMRKAHRYWVRDLKCVHLSYKGYPVFILSGIIAFFPFILYVTARSSLRVKDVTIMQPRRLASLHSSSASLVRQK